MESQGFEDMLDVDLGSAGDAYAQIRKSRVDEVLQKRQDILAGRWHS